MLMLMLMLVLLLLLLRHLLFLFRLFPLQIRQFDHKDQSVDYDEYGDC